MRTELSLAELATTISEQSHAKEDYVCNTETMVANEDATCLYLASEHKSFLINDHCHKQLAAALDVPRKYYNRMRENNPALLSENINSWFKKEPKNRMIRTLGGNSARAYLSDRYKRIDNDRIFSIIAPVLADYPDIVVESAAVTETKMWLKVVSPKTEREISLNDPIQAGMVITNSEVGDGAYDIQPFTKRLVCHNGMTVLDAGVNMRTTHVGKKMDAGLQINYAQDTIEKESEYLISKSRDIAKAIVEGDWFDDHIEKLREAKTEEIDGRPSKAIGKLAKTFGLAEREQENVLEHFMRGGDFSKFGMAQAVTRTAEDIRNYERASTFEAMGSKVIDLPQKAWKSIALAA